jgi:hypothetical protein
LKNIIDVLKLRFFKDKGLSFKLIVLMVK